MSYPFRAGAEDKRLELIWEIYNYIGSSASGILYNKDPFGSSQLNKNREHPIAWDLAQIFAAIAGGYIIELSPHYKGVQLIRRSKPLWERVSKFVKLKTGVGCLPYDPGKTGEKWEIINDCYFFKQD